MTGDEQRLVWRFLDWARAEGYSLCERGLYTWRPVSQSGGTLIERFAASLAQRQQEPEPGGKER